MEVRTVSPTSSFLRSTCSSACPPAPAPVTCPRAPGQPAVLDNHPAQECPGGRGTQGTVSSLHPSLHVWARCPNEEATTSARVIPDDNQ